MLALTAKVLVAYLIGSLSGSLLLGRLGGFDVRRHGSGNAGGTNALRTRGLRFALGVMVIDIGKGVLAVAVVPGWPAETTVDPGLVTAACGLGVILGHMYPVFFGFRGGKGAAAFVGGAGVMLPSALGPVLLIWALMIVLTGYVGLATICAATSFFFVALWLADPAQWSWLLPYAALGALLVIYAHRSNIRRLFEGTENRFDRVRVQNWRR
ncbi:MAG: glycerol-3-phosphate 1-O-acyltransferase PlsY [Pseudomonadota bacterium]